MTTAGVEDKLGATDGLASSAISAGSAGSTRATWPAAPDELDCVAAEALGGKICAAAARAAQSECQLLELIAEFDAGNAVRWWDGVKSLAHWLSWACSMSPGTAREHVRVARALYRMPTTRAAFAEGRLSYSKVREISRVVDTVDEADLCELALRATAAQLAKTVAGYRTASGSRIRQERERGLSWTQRESGLVDLRVRLPKEEAGVLLAAIAAAQDQYGSPPAAPATPDAEVGSTAGCAEPAARLDVSQASDRPEPAGGTEADNRANSDRTDAASGSGRATPTYTRVDALLDVARVFLNAAPEDRSGEDRSLVVVHVNLDQLTDSDPITAQRAPDQPRTDLPRTDQSSPDQDSSVKSDSPDTTESVPAGTSTASGSRPALEPTCHVQGVGGIERHTARRLACDTDLLGAIIDAHGDVLALGRTRRLVTRALRRALMIRDRGICQFTGCHQTHHLKAHHLIHWVDGGRTDLDNLILLCQFHHTTVHEGQMTIRAAGPRRWEFMMPDGKPHRDWYTAEGLLNFLAQHAEGATEQLRVGSAGASTIDPAVIDQVDSFHHPEAQRIQPGWRGERYDRHEAVQALFRMPIRQTPASESTDPMAA